MNTMCQRQYIRAVHSHLFGCSVPVHQLLVPVFSASSLASGLLGDCLRGWVQGYAADDELVLQLSPWYLCSAARPTAALSSSPHPGPGNLTAVHISLHCTKVTDWSGTRLGHLAVVQHLEYWSLGSTCLAVILVLVILFLKNRLTYAKKWNRAAIVLLMSSILLSLVSLLVFTTHNYKGLQGAHGSPITNLSYGWAFYVRACSGLLCCTSSLCAVFGDVRTRCGVQDDEDNDNNLMITSLNPEDFVYTWNEYGGRL